MSKALLLVFFVALCAVRASSQTPLVRVKGRVFDKNSMQPLADATVALLYAKDSSRADGSFTTKDGSFLLQTKSDRYLLYVTFIGYQPILQQLIITPQDTLINMGDIQILPTGVHLKTVEIVTIRTPMVVKKDTLEFNADAYKTRENAVMEELLKKLPGVQVQPDGTITVNGVVIKTILVNGKPFFGDDPKMASRNLPADMIDKVQLIDKKTEQADFTGVDDGKREKAINITVKKSREGQLIGKLAAGYGTDDRFAGGGNLNRFNGDEQLSVIGTFNNVNNDAFIERGEIEGDNAGIARALNLGGNYSKSIGDKLKLNASYTLNDNRREMKRQSARQNLLPDSVYYYNQNANTINQFTNHNLQTRLEFKPDTLQLFSFMGRISHVSTNNSAGSNYETLGGERQLVNKGTLQNTQVTNAPSVNLTGFWAKRFKQPGRALSASAVVNYANNSQEGTNNAYNLFVQPGGDIYADTINQRNDMSIRSRYMMLSASYTEPVAKNRFLDFSYSYIRMNITSGKKTYDYDRVKGEYDKLNDSLSNAFKNITIQQRAAIYLRTRMSRYDYALGINLQLTHLQSNNLSQENQFQQKVLNISPFASFNYTFKNNNTFRFSYSGIPQMPSITQLQPVPDNRNPLYIQLGNPDLKPAFMNVVTLGYNAFNNVSMRGFGLNFSADVITNKIIAANWFDSLGRQVSQPQNVNGAYHMNMYMTHSFYINPKASLNTTTIADLNQDVNYINGLKGNTRNLNFTQELSFAYTYNSLLDLTALANANYNGIRYSTLRENNTDFLNYRLGLNANINLPLSFHLGGNVSYIARTGRPDGFNQYATILNTFISKEVLPRKQGLIKIQCFDLLGQNISISRDVAANYIEDVRTTVLQRFFMVSVTYFIKPAGKKIADN